MSRGSLQWDTSDIPFQDGRRFLITGANSGIGYATAVELARHGAVVLLACRDHGRGTAALARLRSEAAGPHSAAAESCLLQLDLASLSSVQQVADQLHEQGLPLHGLINNAGVYEPPVRTETADGFELQFGTNVLGHFALTLRLLPLLEMGRSCRIDDAPRIVSVASIAHKFGRIDLDDLQSERRYNARAAYAQSKLANLMLSFELERQLRDAQMGILSLAAHPGVADTNLFKRPMAGAIERTLRTLAGHIIGLTMNSEVEGALPLLYAATATEAKGGGYYGPTGLAETRGGNVGKAEVRPQARDEKVQKQLWERCEKLTGLRFEAHACPDKI